MTVRIDLLRQAIAFLRANPSLYNQQEYIGRNGAGCAIGRASIIAGKGFSHDTRWSEFDAWAKDKNGLNLSGRDWMYIADANRTLDEIENYVNEIDDCQGVNPDSEIKLRVNDKFFTIIEAERDAFLSGVKAAGGKVFLITEVEL